MKLTDPALVDLIRAKHAQEQDLLLMRALPFLPDDALTLAGRLCERLLVLLPGAFYPLRQIPSGLCLQENSDFPDCMPPGTSVCWADIRLLKQERFRLFLRRSAFYEWILPFADCAEPAEPGYLGSYTLPDELRTELSPSTGITALFSHRPSERLTEACFDMRRTIVLDSGGDAEAQSLLAETEKERLYVLGRLCTKRMLARTAVVFPTRRHAELFAARFPDGGASLVHGGRSREENLAELALFSEGRTTVLAATKHVLPSAGFVDADAVLYAGVPMSPAFLSRCGALSAGAPCLCVYTAQDPALNEGLARSCAASLGFPVGRFTARRNRMQAEVIGMLDLNT